MWSNKHGFIRTDINFSGEKDHCKAKILVTTRIAESIFEQFSTLKYYKKAKYHNEHKSGVIK